MARGELAGSPLQRRRAQHHAADPFGVEGVPQAVQGNVEIVAS